MKTYRKAGSEILAALKELGPSTMPMIEMFTKMNRNNLRQAMKTLRRKNLVDMLIGDERTFFYQINQSLAARSTVSKALCCSSDDLEKPLLRRQDRYHNQWCEFWSWNLRTAIPQARVVRDYDLGSNEIARNVLLIDQYDGELLPDFLAIFPGADNQHVTIAFEIERTRKSKKRLVRKFSRYMEETRLDGVVYICDNGRLAELLRSLYQTRLVDKSERVRHYVNHFFLFSNSFSASGDPLASFLNVNGQQESLSTWIATLSTTSRSKRRDADFEKLPPGSIGTVDSSAARTSDSLS